MAFHLRVEERLAAVPAVVLVDLGKGESNGVSKLTYKKEVMDELWTRFDGGNWTQLDVLKEVGTEHADTEGTFITPPMKPGSWFEAAITPQKSGPASADTRFLCQVLIPCIHQGPASKTLIKDHVTFTAGGTWVSAFVETSVETLLGVASVAYKPVPTDANGLPDWAVFSQSAILDFFGRAKQHRVDIQPLWPGNAYYAAIMVVDQNGNWQIAEHRDALLKRSGIVQIPTITIVDDGDNDGTSVDYGEIAIKIGTSVGQDSYTWSLPPSGSGNAYIELTESTINVGWEKTFPARAVANDNDAVGRVGPTGLEYDAFGHNEQAGNFETIFDFPYGQQDEAEWRGMDVDCPTSNNQTFHFRFSLRWRALYS